MVYFVKEAVRLGGIQGELYIGGGAESPDLKDFPNGLGSAF